MYKNILVPLDNSETDNVILNHIRPLARMTNARILFVHVADGFMARNQKDLGESEEMRDDYKYLREREKEFRNEGFDARSVLLFGEPYKEILALADKEGSDLIAMATHGHRGLSDIILGSVATEIRHKTRIPVLQIRG
ncbi:MAG TPA: universal stress protein [Bacteroidales bacterium]|jgi:manganese transport protein|nr:universal stress protein [Bacteroidales bacterium]